MVNIALLGYSRTFLVKSIGFSFRLVYLYYTIKKEICQVFSEDADSEINIWLNTLSKNYNETKCDIIELVP